MRQTRLYIIGRLPLIVGCTLEDERQLHSYQQQECVAAVKVRHEGQWKQGIYQGEEDILYVLAPEEPTLQNEGVLSIRRRQRA